MSTNETDAVFVEERHASVPLQRTESPSMDAYGDHDNEIDSVDQQRMFMLDVTAAVVATIMALGPLSVYSIFGS